MIIKVGVDEVISNQKSCVQFIDKMGKLESVKEMWVICGKGIDDEFDGGLLQECVVDEMDNWVLVSGVVEFVLIIQGDEVLLRMVVLYIVKKDFCSINCLECYGVEDGVVVGVVSVIIDVKEDLVMIKEINIGMWIGQGVL